MGTTVLYYWCGYAKKGQWIGYTKTGLYAIDDPHYSDTETKAIYPYDPLFEGKVWNDIPILKNVPFLI